jgi:hypothetical protein
MTSPRVERPINDSMLEGLSPLTNITSLPATPTLRIATLRTKSPDSSVVFNEEQVAKDTLLLDGSTPKRRRKRKRMDCVLIPHYPWPNNQRALPCAVPAASAVDDDQIQNHTEVRVSSIPVVSNTQNIY